ncbi:MAG: hypothetical protein WC769_01500 [Thermodesulfovibrionales bacterium]|jgi:hypothetical protein
MKKSIKRFVNIYRNIKDDDYEIPAIHSNKITATKQALSHAIAVAVPVKITFEIPK